MDFKEIDSAVIKAVAHDPADDTLFIQFHQGRRYAYQGVPASTLEKMMDSESAGRFFHQNIKPYFQGSEVTDD